MERHSPTSEWQPPSDCRERLPPPPDHSQGAALPTPPPQTGRAFLGKVPYLLSHWMCFLTRNIQNYVTVFIANLFFNMSLRNFCFYLSYAISQPCGFYCVVWQSTEIFKNILLAELVAFLANWMLGPKASPGSCSIPLVVCSLSRRPTLSDCPCSCEGSRYWCSKCPHPLFHWGHSGDILISFSLLTGIFTVVMFPYLWFSIVPIG